MEGEVIQKQNILKRFWYVYIVVSALIVTIPVIYYFFSQKTEAAATTCYWVGDSSPADWNDASHWSNASGGAGSTCDGGVVPGADDNVIFDSANTNNCNVDISPTVNTLYNVNYSGTFSLNANTLTLVDDFTYGAGTLNLNAGNLTVGGALNLVNSTFDAGTSTVIMNGAANEQLRADENEFYNLTISTLTNLPYSPTGQGNLSVGHLFEVAAGVDLEFNLSSILTLKAGATLDLNSTGELHRNADGFLIVEDAISSTLPTDGTIGIITYFKTVTGNITITPRTYLRTVSVINETASDYSATIGTATGQTITSMNLYLLANSDGDIILDASVHNPTVNVLSPGSTTSGILSLAGTGGGQEILKAGNGTWTIDKDLNLGTGSLEAGESTFITKLWTPTITCNSQSFYNLTIQNAGRNITFADSCTVTNTFTDITPLTHLYFTANQTYTFADINIAGDVSNDIDFHSTSPGTRWNLNVSQASPTVSYLDVQDSDASGGSTIDATDGTNTNSGNNINWDFGSRYWVAGSLGNWSDTSNWSFTDGGSSGAILPTTTTDVYFNSNGVGNCNVDQTVDIKSLDLDVGYTGTFDANSYTMSISNNIDLTGGTFVADSSTITLDGTDGQTLTAGGESLNILTITNANTLGVTTSGSISVATLNAVTNSSKIFFDNIATFSVTSTFNVGGSTYAGRVYLHSDSDSNQWNLSVPSSASKSYLNVMDSVVNQEVTCYNSRDGGNNNANWIFIPNLQDGLLLYNKLDGDYNDYSGNDYHGTPAAGANINNEGMLVANGETVSQAGADLPDTNDAYYNVSTLNPSTEMGVNFSISTWIKKDDPGDSWAWILGEQSGSHFLVGKQNGVDNIHVNINGVSITDGGEFVVADFCDNEWHLLTVTVNQNVITIYIDDNAGVSKNFTGAPSASNLRVGVTNLSYTQHWNGEIDEMRIYDKVIGTTEIDYLYNNYFSTTGNWSTSSSWVTTQTPTNNNDLNIKSGTLTLDGNHEIDRVSISAGGLNFSSNTLTAAEDVDFSNGSIVAGTGGLTLSGTSAQTFTTNDQTVNNLTVTNAHASGVTFSGGLTISGTLTDVTASSRLIFDNTATYTVNNITLNGQDTGTRVELESDSAGNQFDLVASGTQSISNVSATDSDAFDGDAIDADDGTCNNGGGNINWLFSATTRYWVGADSNFYDNNNWSTSSGGAGGASSPTNNDLVIFDDQDTTNITLENNVTVVSITNTGGYSSTFDSNDKAVTLSGNLRFDGGNLDLGMGTWRMAGDFDVSGTILTEATSTLLLNGSASQTVTTGDNNLNSIFVTNSSEDGVVFADGFEISDIFANQTVGSKMTFSAGDTYYIADILIDGSDGNLITLVSSTSGTAANFNVSVVSPEVSYLQIKDLNASGGNQIDALTGCINSGGNTNWLFAVSTVVISPSLVTLTTGNSQTFIASAFDAQSYAIPSATFTWSVESGGGSISSGIFTAGDVPETYTDTIKATYLSVSGRSSVVVNASQSDSSDGTSTTDTGSTGQVAVDNIGPYPVISCVEKAEVESEIDFSAKHSSDNVGIESYTWNFGDKIIDYGVNTKHTYNVLGRYLVKLSLFDSAKNKASASKRIDIIPPKPTLLDVKTKRRNLILKGKAYPGTVVTIVINSDPYQTETASDSNGNWQKEINVDEAKIGQGEHQIFLTSEYHTTFQEQKIVLASEKSDFNISLEDDGRGLRAELEGLKKSKSIWITTLSLVILFLIIFILIRRRKRKKNTNHRLPKIN